MSEVLTGAKYCYICGRKEGEKVKIREQPDVAFVKLNINYPNIHYPLIGICQLCEILIISAK